MEFFITCPINIERMYDKYRMTIQHQDFQVEFFERPMGGDNITQNELSGRYRTIPDRSYQMPNDVDSICEAAVNNPKYGEWFTWQEDWASIMKEQYGEYQSRLNVLKEAEKAGRITNAQYKRAREVWRGILGTAFLTDMRITMNLHAFEHIINQRLAPESQLEARVVAYHMLKSTLDAGVATVAASKMFEHNGWSKWFQDVENKLQEDNG
jgi:thymidylate synthase ThyX